MEGKVKGLHKVIKKLESLNLLHIIIISFMARILVLLTLPNTPSSFGPDEGTYANLSRWVEQSEPVSDFPTYGPGLYNSCRSFIWPAVFFIRLGLLPLEAVRFTSIIYGVLTIYIFGKFLFEVSDHLKVNGREIKSKFLIPIILVFAFFPSSFLWSVLGLRESASSFWIILSCYLTFLVAKTKVEKIEHGFKYMHLALLASLLISVTLAFGARRETALVFLAFFLMPISFVKGMKLLIISVCLTTFILGHLFTATPNSMTIINQDKSVTNSEASDRLTLGSAFSDSALTVVPKLSQKRIGNTINANTAIATTECQSNSQLFPRLKCIQSQFLYSLVSILIRPIPIIDSGSAMNNFASVENLFWVLLLLFFAYSSFYLIRKKMMLFLIVPTTLFVLGFASLSALYEGNLGTAFRHKSTILWPILLINSVYFLVRSKGKIAVIQESE